MPVIARFYGMVIKMYFRQSEHNPPHIHVIYGECVGVIDIRTGEMLEGDLSKRALKWKFSSKMEGGVIVFHRIKVSIPIKTSTFFGNSEHSFPEKQSIPFRNRVQFIF